MFVNEKPSNIFRLRKYKCAGLSKIGTAVVAKCRWSGLRWSDGRTAMDNLAREQDRVLQRIQRANVQGECGPKLNEEKDPSYWLSQPGSPKAKVNEKPQGMTVNYDKLIQAWREGRVK